MNSILFKDNPPFKLEKNDERLAHIRNFLHTPENGEIYAGKLNEYLCVAKIHYLEDGSAELLPSRQLENPQPLPLTFCAAFTRPQIAQRILFEAACFGVKNLIFYAAQKSESAYAQSRLYTTNEHIDWLIKGAQQACCASIPNFYTAENLDSCIAKAKTLEPNFENLPDKNNSKNTFLEKFSRLAPDVYEAEISLLNAILQRKKTFFENLDKNSPPLASPHFTILIGGERGFNSPERLILRANGYSLTSLGLRVLRTDTAAISSLSTLSQIPFLPEK